MSVVPCSIVLTIWLNDYAIGGIPETDDVRIRDPSQQLGFTQVLETLFQMIARELKVILGLQRQRVKDEDSNVNWRPW